MFRLRRPSDEECRRFLGNAAVQGLTYAEAGATRSGDLPGGYRHDRHVLALGPASLFDSAVGQLMKWRAQTGAGAQVVPDDRVAQEGSNHLVLLKLAVVWAIAPVRIVYVVEERDRQGFGYGTLPGHPESGEESFIVERRGDQTLFQITAFSKPSGWLVRLGQPFARAVQSRTTRRYLQSLKSQT